MHEIKEIDSIQEYIKYIKEYSEKRDDELWYRGHSNDTWKITPNLFRNAKMKGKSNELRKLSYDFVNFSDEFLDLKEKIIEENLFNILGLNDFKIMFIAQHYGLLTPIVDWTIDPLIALFFAIESYEYNDDTYPVVYILKPELSNKYTKIGRKRDGIKELEAITKPLCIDGISNDLFKSWTKNLNETPANHVPIAIFTNENFSHRISKQSGKFTFHGAVGPLNYEWKDITVEGEKFVDIIKINPHKVEEIKEYLTALNITERSVYVERVELDTICNDIKQNSLEKFKENIAIANKNFK